MKGAKQLVTEATPQIETLTPDEAIKLAVDENVVFVDLREPAKCTACATWASSVSDRHQESLAI